jgi:hypothetical protein
MEDANEGKPAILTATARKIDPPLAVVVKCAPQLRG